MATIGNSDYRWWVGTDGNVWANVEGIGVKNFGQATGGAANAAYRQGFDIDKQISDPNAQGEYTGWSDPNKQAANPTADGSGNGGGSGSSEDAATNARMRGIYDQQISDINRNLGTQDVQLNNALAGVKGEYDTYKNEQQSSYNQAKNNYDQSSLQNRQNLQFNRNTITNNASSAMRGLLRMLGAMGAGGSSVARYNVPEMVRNQANDEYNNAGKTFAQNQQNLDTNWGNYKINAENDRKKLEDWYNGQVKSKQQESEERKQSLLNELVTAYGNRAQYGGDYGNNVSDAFNRIAQSRDAVTNLGQYTTPNYTGTTAVYNAPSLDNYNANTASVATGTTDSNTSASSPLLTALQSLTKRKENNQ